MYTYVPPFFWNGRNFLEQQYYIYLWQRLDKGKKSTVLILTNLTKKRENKSGQQTLKKLLLVKWNFKFYLKCPSKLLHLVRSMGSQTIMNYVCWNTDTFFFEANLHHSPKTCKFIKIAAKFVIEKRQFQ